MRRPSEVECAVTEIHDKRSSAPADCARLFGLIGRPLEHSLSRVWFRERFALRGLTDCRYENFPLDDISALPALLCRHPQLCGLNVTSPYKRSVIPYLDELTGEAARIDAVNCIVIRNGRLVGHNTDCYGFRRSLEEWLEAEEAAAPENRREGRTQLLPVNNRAGRTLPPQQDPPGADRIPPPQQEPPAHVPAGRTRLHALLLGTGGAARAAAEALRQLGIPLTQVSRTPSGPMLGYDALDGEVIASHRLIINATPLGTRPDPSAPPLPYELLGPGHLLYDVVYNPPLTPFLKRGAARGAIVRSGLRMLELQAERSWELFGLDK